MRDNRSSIASMLRGWCVVCQEVTALPQLSGQSGETTTPAGDGGAATATAEASDEITIDLHTSPELYISLNPVPTKLDGSANIVRNANFMVMPENNPRLATNPYISYVSVFDAPHYNPPISLSHLDLKVSSVVSGKLRPELQRDEADYQTSPDVLRISGLQIEEDQQKLWIHVTEGTDRHVLNVGDMITTKNVKLDVGGSVFEAEYELVGLCYECF